MLSDAEDIQAELVSKFGIAHGVGGPLNGAVLAAGSKVALPVTDGQDAELQGALVGSWAGQSMVTTSLPTVPPAFAANASSTCANG